MKRKTGISQGTRCDLTAQRFGISGQMFSMYIKLNDLLSELMELVDYNAEKPKCGIQVNAGY